MNLAREKIMLMKEQNIIEPAKGNELILMPESLRDRAVQYAHEGHMGIVLCKRLLRNRCWWPGLDKQVEETVDNCPACQANTDTTYHEPMIPTRLKEDKMGLSSIDFSSVTPSGEYLLVIHYETGRLPVVKISNSRQIIMENSRITDATQLYSNPHSSTGISPDVYMSGDDQFDKIPTLRSEISNGNAYKHARVKEAKAKEKQRIYADMHQRKHQPLFDPNPYVISAIKGNMITGTRADRSTTRNSRFFKSITEKCFKEAQRLLGTKKTRMDVLLKYMLQATTTEPGVDTAVDQQVQQTDNVLIEPEPVDYQERYPQRIRKQAKRFDQSVK